MRWTRHSLATLLTSGVVVAWVAFYALALTRADTPPAPGAAVVQLTVPSLLWILAVNLLVRRRRSGTGSRTSAMDPPQRLLSAAVAALPERRSEWGRAMIAELAEVRGRPARWRFALSSARATLWLPPLADRWVLALVSGTVAASAVAAGSAAGKAAPGLTVFATTFAGLVGAMAVLGVAGARRLQFRAPAATVVVTGTVAASIAFTVIFLRREPSAAQYLPPAAAVCLAAVLAGCLWVAVAPPRWLGTSRLGPHLGVAAGVVFAAWFLLSNRADGTEPPAPLVPVLGAVLVLVPVAALFAPAFVAGRAGRSLRSGLQAAVWTVTSVMPLTYALWLPEALRRHAIDGATLDGELVAPAGVNLSDALIFCFGIFPVFALTLGLLGATFGARHTGSPWSASRPGCSPNRL